MRNIKPSPACTLLVLPPSHYCERARWALDFVERPYVERPLAVGLHVLKAKAIAQGTTLPILVTSDRTIQGSGAILDWTEMVGKQAEIESRFETRTGILVRAFVYSATLHDRRSGIKARLFDKVPATQAVLGRLLWPMTRRLMTARMGVGPDRVTHLASELSEDLDWFAARLGDGRPYIGGDRFGRADLTVASLLGPIVGLVTPSAQRLRLSDAAEAQLAGWRDHPALAFAKRVYRQHRRSTIRSLQYAV